MSFIDEIKKWLNNASPTEKSAFIEQILAEKKLQATFKKAGLSTEDLSGRARQLPQGVLSRIMKVDLVDLITEIKLISKIDLVAAITEISNIVSLDLVDKITQVDLVSAITTLGTLNLLNTVNLVKEISSITNIANLASVDLIDRITLIDGISTIANIDQLSLIGNIQNVQSVDLIDRITLIDEITTIGEITKINDPVIQAPNIASGFFQQSLNVPPSSALYLETQTGIGKLIMAIFRTSQTNAQSYLTPIIEIDGNNMFSVPFTFVDWQVWVVTTTSNGIQIGVWDTNNNNYSLLVTLNFPFQTQIRVGFYNSHASNYYAGYISYWIEKIA